MVARLGKRRLVFTCLFLILAVAIFLRFFGISFGYPYHTHTDEPAVMISVLSMASDNTLFIRGFERPDSNIKIIDTILVRLYSQVIHGTSFQEPIHIDVDTEYYIVARCWSAVLGVLMVLVAYLIGRQFSTTTGLIAAVLFALNSSFVEHSHYVTSDISITLNSMLVMLCGIAYIRRPTRKRLIGMCFFAALAVLDKYSGMLSSGMIAVVVISCHWKNWKEIFVQGLMAIAMYVGFMVVCSPSVFYHIKLVLHAFFVANEPSHLGADGLGFWGNIQFYWQEMCTDLGVPGWLPIVLIGVAAVVMLLSRDKRCFIFSIVPIWWVGLSALSLHWERWGVPLYAGIILVSSYLLGALFSMLKRKLAGQRRWSVTVRAICAVAFGLYILNSQLPSGITAAATVASPSTSVLSMSAVEQYGLTAENTAYDPRTPLWITSNGYIAWPNKFVLFDGQLYRKSPDTLYVLESSWQQPRYEGITKDVNEKYATWYESYDVLHAQLEPIYTLSPASGYQPTRNALSLALRRLVAAAKKTARKGPVIKIYDVSDLPVWVEAE